MVKDDEFLKEFFADCQNAMRWRSETEWRLLNLFMVLYPIIAGAVLGISELVHDKTLFLVLALSMTAFLTVLTIFLTAKVKAEHRVYEALGQQVVKIWQYFGLFEKGAYIEGEVILEEKARGYGKGKGHLRTLNILWAMTVMTDAILIAIGAIAYLA